MIVARYALALALAVPLAGLEQARAEPASIPCAMPADTTPCRHCRLVVTLRPDGSCRVHRSAGRSRALAVFVEWEGWDPPGSAPRERVPGAVDGPTCFTLNDRRYCE